MEVFVGSIALYNNFKSIVLICINKISTTSLAFNKDKLSAKILVSEESLQETLSLLISRPAKGGGAEGAKYLGPDWFGGPEILIKYLVIVLLSRGLGARNT